jgi:hypothetical protein
VSDERGQTAGGGDEAQRGNLDAAMARLQAAVDRVAAEIEGGVRDEWVRAKPELRQRVADLQTVVDDLAQRAKTALGDLSARLDERKGERGSGGPNAPTGGTGTGTTAGTGGPTE